MADVLYVSKPVVPPWNDSSKNLVHTLATHLTRHRGFTMGLRDSPDPWCEPVYGATGDFRMDLREQARVFGRLATGPRRDLWHFFFAPNPRSSYTSAAVSRLRRVSTVQTVCSAPAEGARAGWFFADRTVALSRHTFDTLCGLGVDEKKLRIIPPAIAPLAPRTEEEIRQARQALGVGPEASMVVYPGDLEFGGGAEMSVRALTESKRHLCLMMACRAKTPRAALEQARLEQQARRWGVQDKLVWIGETSRIHPLLGAADAVVLPSQSLYAKMDYPLVALEAMSMARAVIVSKGTAAAELAQGGAALAVENAPGALSSALDEVLGDEGLRSSLGERARAKVMRDLAPSTMADAYESLYDELV